MSIFWTDDLATGIEAIDAQHRELYAQIAQLHTAMRLNQLARVPHLVDFLQRYVFEHFALEEESMAAIGYAGLPEHAEAHRAFATEFLRLRASLDAGVTASLVIELSDWLGRWLREHVRGVDAAMASALKGQAARRPARG